MMVEQLQPFGSLKAKLVHVVLLGGTFTTQVDIDGSRDYSQVNAHIGV